MGRAITVACALAAAVALGGCGVLASATPPAQQRASTQLARVQTTHELPTPARPQHARGSVSASQAIRRFAERYVNWSADGIATRMRALAKASVGQARSEMALTAAQVRSDRTLRRAGIANHGTVEAVARLDGRPGRYVVVTRERTTATYTTAYQGLAPAWHVTVAGVVRVTLRRRQTPGRGGHTGRPRRRWAVSLWQPEG